MHERHGISTDTAMRLARYLGTDMEMWVNLQAQYEAVLLEDRKGAEFARIAPHASVAALTA